MFHYLGEHDGEIALAAGLLFMLVLGFASLEDALLRRRG